MNNYITDSKKAVEFHHERGHKVLMIGQPLAGTHTAVPKATYISCINLFNPLAMIDLLQRYKVASTIKILGDFPIDANRNRFVDDALAAGADYLMFMDMDMTFPSDALQNLFEIISDQCPIVSGMYFLKKEPYSPVMGRYVEWDDDLRPYKNAYDKLGFVHPDGRQLVMWRAFSYFDRHVPFRADVIGLGCVLMRAEVFKDLEYPYFHYSQDPRPEHKHKTMYEVMPFCAQLAKKNIPIFIDPRVQCGHITSIDSNVQIFESYRDSQFALTARQKPEEFHKIQKLLVDVREEKRNGSRIKAITNSNGACRKSYPAKIASV